MKHIALTLIILFLFADVARAATMWDTPRSAVQNHQLVYLAVRDEYQLRYAISGLPSGTHSVRANFWTTTNVYYEVVFENPTGVAYITCNGTYIFEVLDNNGVTIAETTKIITHKIKNPPCSSYQNEGLKKHNMDGYYNVDTKQITLDSVDFDYYTLYKDGEILNTVSKQSIINNANTIDLDVYPDGSYSVVGHNGQSDDYDNVQGYFDFTIGGNDGWLNGDNGGGGDSGGNTSCDACKWLTDALACPSWNDYMGDLTNAIRDALPEPPNWDDIASTFVDHFADYFGDVPTIPSKAAIDNNITPTEPTLDLSVPESSMIPQVPDNFNNGPLDTDITTGEVINIVDESEPIEIFEPDAFIASDDEGVMVYPGDQRNSSNGIKEPDTIDTGYSIPTPQPVPTSDIPIVDVPLPSGQPSTMPTPQPIDNNPMPTPQPREGG